MPTRKPKTMTRHAPPLVATYEYEVPQERWDMAERATRSTRARFRLNHTDQLRAHAGEILERFQRELQQHEQGVPEGRMRNRISEVINAFEILASLSKPDDPEARALRRAIEHGMLIDLKAFRPSSGTPFTREKRAAQVRRVRTILLSRRPHRLAELEALFNLAQSAAHRASAISEAPLTTRQRSVLADTLRDLRWVFKEAGGPITGGSHASPSFLARWAFELLSDLPNFRYSLEQINDLVRPLDKEPARRPGYLQDSIRD
jgi:hypothetical protein